MTSIRPNTFAVPQRRDHMVEKFKGNEKASGVPCPMLSTLVNEGLMTPNAEGEVSLKDLKAALQAVGLSPTAQKVLAHGGAKATETLEKGVLNLLKLEGSSLDHRGSLGPLQDGGFNAGLLDQLKSFSSDGDSLTLDDLAAAQKSRLLEEDGGVKDTVLGYAEIAALLLVIGTPNAEGTKSISLENLDRIFKDNKLPEDFEAKSVGLIAVGWNALKLAWKQNIGSAGARAEKGLREAMGEQSPVDASSMMGLGAMCPAGMKPKADGAGATPGDMNKLHQGLEQAVKQQQAALAGA